MKTKVKWVRKRDGRKKKRGESGGQCAVCYLGLISCLTDHSKMERRGERESSGEREEGDNWSWIFGQIYCWASQNDTANKTSLTAAILAKHLETCHCSSFVTQIVGQLGKTCAVLTLVARKRNSQTFGSNQCCVKCKVVKSSQCSTQKKREILQERDTDRKLV